MKKVVALADIDIQGSPLVRLQLREETVSDYAAAYRNKRVLPPPDLFESGNGTCAYLVADGRHRLQAAIEIQRTSLLCEVHPGGRDQCIKFAVGANSEHGLPRSSEDKRAAVMLALREFPALSSRAIADLCKVAHSFVDRVRLESQVASEATSTDVSHSEPDKAISTVPVRDTPSGGGAKKVAAPEKRTGLDGKSYPPALATPKVKELRDKIGILIDPREHSMWNRASEVKPMLDKLQDVKKGLEIARRQLDEGDLLFREVNIQFCISDLDRVIKDIERAVPFTVCWMCQGKQEVKCGSCHGRRFMSQYAWKSPGNEKIKKMHAAQGVEP